MEHCSECGSELTDNPSFCPDCGSEMRSVAPQEKEKNKPKGTTAPCQKCDSPISTKADRCPQCGFEPGSEGILHGIFTLISFLWLGIGIIFYIGAFGALFTGNYSIGGFLGGLLLITLFSALPFTYLYVIFTTADRGPTEPLEIFGQKIN